MKLLLDECVVHDLKRDLAEHDVATATEAGFSGLANGELLQAAANRYDVLITVDRNLRYQQDISELPIAVIVIRAGGITYHHLKPFVPQILKALHQIKPGTVVDVH